LQATRTQAHAVQRIDSVQRRLTPPSRQLVLLAPPNALVPSAFQDAREDDDGYHSLLSEMQHFRGKIYLNDGAIRESDLVDGRHVVAGDDSSWHLLVRDGNGAIAGCIRYQVHDLGSLFLRLSVFSTSIAKCPSWGPALRQAVHSEMSMAKRLALSFVEVGGWALAEHVRGTSEALRMGLAAYSLGQLLGGAVGVSTATRRHCSSSILRRMGGKPLEHDGVAIPAYYDPQYDCDMEILRFHSWNPNPRFQVWIQEIGNLLQRIPLIGCPGWALAAAG
jgi:hypothetical protein